MFRVGQQSNELLNPDANFRFGLTRIYDGDGDVIGRMEDTGNDEASQCSDVCTHHKQCGGKWVGAWV